MTFYITNIVQRKLNDRKGILKVLIGHSQNTTKCIKEASLNDTDMFIVVDLKNRLE